MKSGMSRTVGLSHDRVNIPSDVALDYLLQSRRCCEWCRSSFDVARLKSPRYDQGQLLASAVELALILPESSPSRGVLTDFARSILKYLPRHLTSPDGGFYSAEDADSLPTPQSKHTKEGAFYTWTAQELRDVLGADSEILEWVYGVKMDGNCDPAHDIQGELTGQVCHETLSVEQHNGSRRS